MDTFIFVIDLVTNLLFWYSNEQLNKPYHIRWGRGAEFKSNLCEDDNNDHSLKGILPKQMNLCQQSFAGVTLNKSNTVIMKDKRETCFTNSSYWGATGRDGESYYL